MSPALAIAEEIKTLDKNAEILFICRAGGGENSPIKNQGYNVEFLNVRGLERRLTLKNAKNLALALVAERKARGIISKFKPDVVIGTGGYVCWPVLHAANALKIPTLLHESNAVPGLVCRLLSKKTSKVILNLKECQSRLKSKNNTAVMGNPLSRKFFSESKESARKKLGLSKNDVYILSYGGSGGAEKMNSVISEVIKSYSSKTPNVKHTHACGVKYFENYNNENFENCNIIAYIENMHEQLSAADIVICRCGAMTLSEISAVGVAAILIPSPNVTDNHQYENGHALEKRGAAILIEEKDLDKESLTKAIKRLVNDKNKRKTLTLAIKNSADLKSREKIAKEVIRLGKQGRGT